MIHIVILSSFYQFVEVQMMNMRFTKISLLSVMIVLLFSIQNVFAGGSGMGMGMQGSYGWNRNGSSASGGERLEMQQADSLLETYITRNGKSGEVVMELMEFEGNFYAQIGDSDSGRLLSEVLIDPFSGYVQPEFGPNMMWNTEYGHMGRWRGWFSRSGGRGLKVSGEEAVVIADEWIKRNGINQVADDYADEFPGYYTIHILENGRITGMLSVNGRDGRVWLHDWHGEYLGMEDSHGGNPDS